MKLIYPFLLAILMFSKPSYSQQDKHAPKQKELNPFNSLKFDKVVMYDYEGGKGFPIIVENGKLSYTVKKQVVLNPQTVQLLNRKIGLKSSYRGFGDACFDPHLAFVYYLKSKVVAYIEVCFDCNRLGSNPEIPVQMEPMVGSDGKVFYTEHGMSNLLKEFFNTILKRYNFSHQLLQFSPKR